jgi:hypothetical protein
MCNIFLSEFEKVWNEYVLPVVTSRFGSFEASTPGHGPCWMGMVNLHGDVRCSIYLSPFGYLTSPSQLILASLPLAKNKPAMSTLHGNVRYSAEFRSRRDSIVAL